MFNSDSVKNTLNYQLANIFGILHIICSIIPLITTFLQIYKQKFNFLKSGLLSSFFFFLSGSFSIFSAGQSGICLVIATFLISIFSLTSAGMLIITSIMDMIESAKTMCYHSARCASPTDILTGMQVLVGLSEMGLPVVSFIISFRDTFFKPSRLTCSNTWYKDRFHIVSLREKERFI